MARGCTGVPAYFLRLSTRLLAVFTLARRVTRLLAAVVSASEEGAALLTTRNLFSGTSNILDRRVFPTETRFCREKWTRRTSGCFVALMRGSRMATGWGRARAWVEARDGSTACDGRVNDSVAAMADELGSVLVPKMTSNKTHLVVACLKTTTTTTFVVFALTGVQSTTQQLSTRQVTFVQIVQRCFFVERLFPFTVLCLVRQGTADPAALVSPAAFVSLLSQPHGPSPNILLTFSTLCRSFRRPRPLPAPSCP